MTHDFDRVIERRGTGSSKWFKYDKDVLPLWLPGNDPHTFFLERARVALNDGALFGTGGQGFVRLNFGAPRALVEQALDRMRDALTSRADTAHP